MYTLTIHVFLHINLSFLILHQVSFNMNDSHSGRAFTASKISLRCSWVRSRHWANGMGWWADFFTTFFFSYYSIHMISDVVKYVFFLRKNCKSRKHVIMWTKKNTRMIDSQLGASPSRMRRCSNREKTGILGWYEDVFTILHAHKIQPAMEIGRLEDHEKGGRRKKNQNVETTSPDYSPNTGHLKRATGSAWKHQIKGIQVISASLSLLEPKTFLLEVGNVLFDSLKPNFDAWKAQKGSIYYSH